MWRRVEGERLSEQLFGLPNRLAQQDGSLMPDTQATTLRQHKHDEYASLAPLFHQLTHSTATATERRQARSRLVTGYLPVAEHIAQRFHGRGQPPDDLTQVAAVGLIHAVDRFDPARGSNFLSFAVPTITGELRRHFRDATWSVRVPRRLKELSTSVRDAATILGQRLGRAPRPSEIAEALGMPIEDVHAGLQAGDAYRSDSLDAGDADITAWVDNRLSSVDHALDVVEDRQQLHPALATLSDREAAVVRMRFVEDLTQSQIAERIGVSQMQVSRLLTAALRTLRSELSQ
jgi:RNA polymerase sigma-B factor